jgi:hypothetical protein
MSFKNSVAVHVGLFHSRATLCTVKMNNSNAADESRIVTRSVFQNKFRPWYFEPTGAIIVDVRSVISNSRHPLTCSILITPLPYTSVDWWRILLGQTCFGHKNQNTLQTSQDEDSIVVVTALQLITWTVSVSLTLKVCCNGDSLRAGKLSWQVYYRVSDRQQDGKVAPFWTRGSAIRVSR